VRSVEPTATCQPVGSYRLKVLQPAAAEADDCVDAFGRRPRYLRLSVTARCNLRCLYCAPESEEPLGPSTDRLSDDELLRLVRVFVRLGIRKVRFTGGEPLLRPGLPALMKSVCDLDGVDEIALTTNAFLLNQYLDELTDAGLQSVNISCDTLREDRFFQITRRRGIDRVRTAIDGALAHPVVRRVKINVVVMRGINDDEIGDFVALCAHPKIDVRFIEFMPTADIAYSRDMLMPEAEVRARISQPLEPIAGSDPSAPATMWSLPGLPGRIGFISTMTHKFCSLCDRVRVTADGRVARCLFAEELLDLRAYLRAGAADGEVRKALIAYWQGKPAGHRLDDPDFHGRPTMIAVGG
jgi:cyclic pyranopterin phosphate synthase